MSSERMRFLPPEERGERPLLKTHDFRYPYRGYYDEGGICRVRLFAKAALPPVVVVSQLEENRNTSITNMAEYLAAEIGAKYFPHRFETPRPFEWLEHYAHPEEEDPALRQIWSKVVFDSYTPRLVALGGVVRTKLGLPRMTLRADTTDRAADRAARDGAVRGGSGAMSCVKLRVRPPVRPEEWQEKREARRQVLAGVRARRRQMITRTKRTPAKNR